MPFISSVRGSLGATGRGVRRRLPPTWVTAAGALSGSPTFHSQRASKTYTLSATPPAGETVSYTITSGSLPSGMALGSANGVIHGTASQQASNTTFNFTATATASGGGTEDRAFSFVVNAPIVQSFTATGPATFSVPTGIDNVDVLVVAGGGGGGNDRGAGGGGGGLVYRPALPVTPAGTVPLSVGAGGANDTSPGGGNSTFGPLTAIGGGTAGPSWPVSGRAGGSGAGAGSQAGTTGGAGQQPIQPGDSGTFGFGNPGGNAAAGTGPGVGAYTAAGGGGGAGAAGQAGFVGPLSGTIPARYPPGSPYIFGAPAGNGFIAGNGGAGKAYDISGSSVFYAGGGGGTNAVDNPSYPAKGYAGAGGQGGGGDGGLAMIPGPVANPNQPHPANGPTNTVEPAKSGQTNRGGGAGGGGHFIGPYGAPGGGGVHQAAQGGPGVVIVRF